MKPRFFNSDGFTLVELVLVMAVLGILAVSVSPSFTTLLNSSSQTGGRGTAGKIQSAINIKYSENVANNTMPFWPATLDNAANGTICSTATPCFGGVVQNVTSGGWRKASNAIYLYSNASVSQVYTYDSSEGTFECTGGSC